MRSLKGGTLSPTPTIQAKVLSQETPVEISTYLASPNSSAAKLQLLSGVISTEITNAWNGVFPTRMHQKIYRTLHKTIILHQHGAWINRNNTLHPETEFPELIDYGRKRTQKKLSIEEEEPNPLDKTWKRQRKASLLREEMWKGTPIPQKRPKTQPSPQDTPSASSESSETDEWPSPKRSKTSTHTSTDSNTSAAESITSHKRSREDTTNLSDGEPPIRKTRTTPTQSDTQP